MAIIEIWKPVVGYEHNYEVSNLGNIRSICITNPHNGKLIRRKNPRMLKQYKDKDGYLLTGLCKNGTLTTFRVHRLIAKAFIPNPLNYEQINHKNEQKDDNRIENLEWCSSFYNNNYGNRSNLASKSLRNNKRQSKPILQITLDGIVVAEYPSAKEAKRQTGIHNITSACNHVLRHKTAGGYIWKWKQ